MFLNDMGLKFNVKTDNFFVENCKDSTIKINENNYLQVNMKLIINNYSILDLDKAKNIILEKIENYYNNLLKNKKIVFNFDIKWDYYEPEENNLLNNINAIGLSIKGVTIKICPSKQNIPLNTFLNETYKCINYIINEYIKDNFVKNYTILIEIINNYEENNIENSD